MSVLLYACMSGANGDHMRVLDPLELVIVGCEPPCEYWELNPSPLQEQ